MEVLEGSLDEERCLCGRMRDEEERILVKNHLGVAHGPCHIWHGPCHLSVSLWVWAWQGQARSCQFEHGSCQFSGILAFKNFHFLESYLDNYLQNNLKN